MLARIVRDQHPTCIALIGSGGSGKTTLAAALGHRCRSQFRGRLLWVRIGAWSAGVALELMGLKLGVQGDRASVTQGIRAMLSAGPTFVVLDNHESDDATAELLGAFRGLPVTWIITARRCLLGGVTIVPVVPPLIGVRRSAFPAVARLTRLLRWNAVALDVAEGLVSSGRVGLAELERRLARRHVDRVTPVAHEDDIPEVRAVVAEAAREIGPSARRMLAILAHMGGDHMDRASLESLAAPRGRAGQALDDLVRLRLVQTAAPGRFTVHATVRYAVRQMLPFDEDVIARHYLVLFERHPERVADEQTQLFALMDWAQERSDLDDILRVRAIAESEIVNPPYSAPRSKPSRSRSRS